MFSTRLFKLQMKAVRMINKSKYNAHTVPLFRSLNLMKIDDIFKLNVFKFYFKYCPILVSITNNGTNVQLLAPMSNRLYWY